jgi:hypothetical protein
VGVLAHVASVFSTLRLVLAGWADGCLALWVGGAQWSPVRWSRKGSEPQVPDRKRDAQPRLLAETLGP